MDKKLQTAQKKREYYERTKARWKDYRESHRDEAATRRRNRINSDPEFRLSSNLRTRLNKAIKSNAKTGSAVSDLGCTIKYLKSYLESMFKIGMTWDNYGKWHIDHIKPLISFDLTNPLELKKACHYTNLQPLWATDNLVKGSK